MVTLQTCDVDSLPRMLALFEVELPVKVLFGDRFNRSKLINARVDLANCSKRFADFVTARFRVDAILK